MDRIKEFLAKCKNLSTVQPDGELFTLENEGLALIDDIRSGEVEVPEKDRVDQLRELVATVTAIQNEAATRIDAHAAREAEMDEALSGLQRPETPEGIEDAAQTPAAQAASEAEAGPEPTEPEPAPEGEPAPDPEPTPEPEGEPAPAEPEAVTAAGAAPTRPPLGAFARPVSKAVVPVDVPPERIEVDYIAAGGERVTSVDRANQLLWQALKDNRPLGGRTLDTRVLTQPMEWPEDQMLHPNAPGDAGGKVDALVAAAMDPASWVDSHGEMLGFTASGQFCAPNESYYAQPTQGDRGRPLRDSLPQMGLDRGSIEVPGTPLLSDIVVDNTNGAIDTIDPSTSTGDKTIQTVTTCPSTVITYLEATPLRLRFDNFNAMTWMERQNAWLQIAHVALDRQREQRLLAKMDALSTAISESFVCGAYRDVLNHLGRVVSAERHRLRMSPDSRFRVVFDYGLFDAMREDLAMQQPGDGLEALARAEAQMRSDLSERGINVTLVWDRWIPAAQGATVATWWPAAWKINIFPEGTFMFGGGQELNVGVTRDGTELTQNTFQLFEEAFETVFKIGSWPAYLFNLQVCVNGVTSLPQNLSGECEGS